MRRLALRFRTVALVAIVVALIGLMGFILIRYALLVRSPEDEWHAAHEIPNTDVNPYGANFFLAREVEPWKRQRTGEMAQQAGLGWAKQQFPWAEIEPLRKGDFVDPVSGESSWAKFDRIVALYRTQGLRVIARLDSAPAWARPPDTRPETPPTDFEEFGDFVFAFVEHFRGRVQYIQIWNEPNIYPEWGEQAVDPVAYTEMLKVAYRRAKEADPNVFVLSAPLAITLGEPHPEPGKWRSMPDLDYLEAMYESGAAFYFDILAANAFGFDLTPEDPPDPDILNFRRVELQREIMERYGDANKAIWFNEYGWNAAPEFFEDEQLIWERVSEEQQAEYANGPGRAPSTSGIFARRASSTRLTMRPTTFAWWTWTLRRDECTTPYRMRRPRSWSHRRVTLRKPIPPSALTPAGTASSPSRPVARASWRAIRPAPV
jgi:hypothetical protein